jgi:hypothetical protein
LQTIEVVDPCHDDCPISAPDDNLIIHLISQLNVRRLYERRHALDKVTMADETLPPKPQSFLAANLFLYQLLPRLSALFGVVVPIQQAVPLRNAIWRTLMRLKYEMLWTRVTDSECGNLSISIRMLSVP